MAGVATININLSLTNGIWQYRSLPSGFQAAVAGQNGPTPGSVFVQASAFGTDVNLTQLTAMGGLCWIQNLGNSVGDVNPLNFVEVGIWDTITLKFYPLMSLLPGEAYAFRLSPNLLKEESGTGTHSTSGTATLRLKAHNASCQCRVDAFDP